MIELIATSRFLVDYFWEYKILSILHLVASLIIVSFLAMHRQIYSFNICKTDKIFVFFAILSVISLTRSFSNDAFLDFVKFTSYLLFYFIGRIIPAKLANGKFLGVTGLIALLSLSALALTGNGYKYWGDVYTFTGGYFYKTDLAIASLIFITVVFVYLNNKNVLFIAFICAVYLIFKSNARIALPLVLILPFYIKFNLQKNFNKISSKKIIIGLVYLSIGMALLSSIDFRAFGMLGFDFSDPYSDANMQGRTYIWHSILQAYRNSDAFEKIFGLGFGADIRATNLLSDNVQLEGSRAHNSYLYLLVCMGLLGSTVFYYLLFTIYSKIPFVLRYGSKGAVKISLLAGSFLILFVWLSMTTEIVIRPQLMILFFFFSGLHVRQYIKLKAGI